MDYQDTGEKRETFLRVEEGTEVATGLPGVGRFRVVAALTPIEVVVEADEERLWVVGEWSQRMAFSYRAWKVSRSGRIPTWGDTVRTLSLIHISAPTRH